MTAGATGGTARANTVGDLGNRGIYVRTLRESIDSGTSVGRMLAGLFASLAEYERELIAERARLARQAAVARGKLPGRPRVLAPDKVALALRMRAAGESVPTIAEALARRVPGHSVPRTPESVAVTSLGPPVGLWTSPSVRAS